MKKNIILVVGLLLLVVGCSNDKKLECSNSDVYTFIFDESGEYMKSYTYYEEQEYTSQSDLEDDYVLLSATCEEYESNKAVECKVTRKGMVLSMKLTSTIKYLNETTLSFERELINKSYDSLKKELEAAEYTCK